MATTIEPAEKKNFSQKMLDGIEKAGNKVPHPVMMFAYLIVFIAVLSALLAWAGVSVTEEIAVPVPEQVPEDAHGGLGGSDVPYDSSPMEPDFEPEYEIHEETIEVQSLLDVEGLRFVFTSFVNNFAGFAVVAVTFVAMAGVGVAEHAGMMAALIRKLVKVAPRRLIAFILIFVGVLSSVASDAGYLILIPLGAAAFLTLGRHPLGRHGCRLCRCRRHLRGESVDHPDRQHADRDHQRGDPCRDRAAHRHRQLLLLGGLERGARHRCHVCDRAPR